MGSPSAVGAYLAFVSLLLAGWSGASGAEDLRDPASAVGDLEVHDGLEVTLFASEPMIGSPTNLDIDERGRVWICEVVNYHRNRGRRKAGDRILILEDTDADGRADTSKVFYQGTDVDSAMGLCVLGNRVIVTSSPQILVLTDTDGDDRPDTKEVLFSKTGHSEHDHSAHSFVFGPDGRLYWNFGNAGGAVHDRNGDVVVDLSGRPVVDNRRPYQGGMVFRCELDGSRFEVLGHNFRNNYEVAVDSFGTVWQTDNDDDGNRGARVNYVMEYGNFGFKDEKTGARWQAERVGWHEDVSHRHWHQNDPGVIPNAVLTGNGAPSGIAVYEGRLLPEVFRDQPLHGDTVTNVVHADQIVRDGAGYRGKALSLLRSRRDRWFRPVDVCTAPDGSVFVTDWYDPGVGGHRQVDVTRGRIYRVAPPATPFAAPRFDFSTADGAAAALRNPNHGVRYLAWTALQAMGREAEPALLEVLHSENPREAARALWLLGRIPGREEHYVRLASQHPLEDLRIVGLRLARQLELDVVSLAAHMAKDPSASVRRECALALRDRKSSDTSSTDASDIWVTLALQHDGKDRWYLEALGIAADGVWEERFDAWLKRVGDRQDTPGSRDIIWRSRARKALPLLTKLILSPTTGPTERLRYFRAFDFHDDPSKDDLLLEIASANHPDQPAITVLAMRQHSGVERTPSPGLHAALETALAATRGTATYVQLVERFELRDRGDALLAFALENADEGAAQDAVRLLDESGELDRLVAALEDPDPSIQQSAFKVLGRRRTGRSLEVLRDIVANPTRSIRQRNLAIETLGRHGEGRKALLSLLRAGRIAPELHFAAGSALLASRDRAIAEEAARYIKMPEAADRQPVPPLDELIDRRGDPDRGRLAFENEGRCATCHVVGGEGKAVGPDLSTIGGKLDRVAFYESIISPSAAISHGYENHVALTRQGEVVSGILREQTDRRIALITADGILRSIPAADVQELSRQNVSLMPADLHKALSVEKLVDLVEYLTTLKGP